MPAMATQADSARPVVSAVCKPLAPKKLPQRYDATLRHSLPDRRAGPPPWNHGIMSPTVASYCYLLIAIVAEVIATSTLKLSQSFTRPWPSLVTILGYGIAFYCLSLTLRTMPTGIAYAIWSGLGIVLISLVSWLFFKQSLDLPAVLGLALIIAGVLVINVFSKSIAH